MKDVVAGTGLYGKKTEARIKAVFDYYVMELAGPMGDGRPLNIAEIADLRVETDNEVVVVIPECFEHPEDGAECETYVEDGAVAIVKALSELIRSVARSVEKTKNGFLPPSETGSEPVPVDELFRLADIMDGRENAEKKHGAEAVKELAGEKYGPARAEAETELRKKEKLAEDACAEDIDRICGKYEKLINNDSRRKYEKRFEEAHPNGIDERFRINRLVRLREAEIAERKKALAAELERLREETERRFARRETD